MVRPRTVSQWGPNAQGVRSRPDRSVSLRDVREQPVQTMGLGQGGAPGKFGGGYGVHTRISELDGEYRVRLFIDGEYQAGADYFTDDVAEAHETAKAMEEDAHLSDKDSDVARDEARDFVEDAIERPHVGEVEVPEDVVADDARLPVDEMTAVPSLGPQVLPQNVPVPNFQGPQVHAMGGELAGQQELPWGRRPQGLAGVQGARDVLGGAVPWTPNPDVVRPPVGGEPPPLPPPVSPMISQMAGPMDYPDWRGDLDDWVPPDEEWSPEGGPEDLWNPESQMDRQYMAETAAQPEQGFLGTLGGLAGGAAGFLGDAFSTLQAVNQQSAVPHAQAAQAQLGAFENASTEDKLAIVLLGLAVAAASTGVGAPLVPLAGAGAGLGAMSSAP